MGGPPRSCSYCFDKVGTVGTARGGVQLYLSQKTPFCWPRINHQLARSNHNCHPTLLRERGADFDDGVDW